MTDKSRTLLNNPYGQVSFDTFRQEDRAFVDKSLVIKYLDDNAMSKYPVLLRPRRFGKSTFVQMLRCFYDISYADRYEELFCGTKIYQENLSTHNTYHVIHFDFSNVFVKDEDTLLKSFCSAVISGIEDFKRRYRDFSFTYDNLDLSDPVTLLNFFTTAYSNYASSERLYVLIDEYDNFANELLSKNMELFLAITSASGFLKTFYAAIKAAAGSGCIAKTFITGVSSVSLDSLTSGFNIALNVTDRVCFNEYAGFTDNELEILIPKLVDVEQLGVSTKEIIARMKPVYDGYCFSGESSKTVFNSSMCLYYLNKVRQKKVFLNPEDYLDPACDQDGYKLEQIFSLTSRDIVDEVIDTYLHGDTFYVEKLSENINLNKANEYDQDQVLSILYYLGYLTIDNEDVSPEGLILKIPNRYMSKLFGKCIINQRLKKDTAFVTTPAINNESLLAVQDDISSFADSCTEFLSRIMTNQVLCHMNEMALNLALFAKLETVKGRNFIVNMQKSIQVRGRGEKYADLVITVNRGKINECIYLIELKYLTKTEATAKDSVEKLNHLVREASEQVLEYKSSLDFKERNVKAYVMVFSGPECIYCELQH